MLSFEEAALIVKTNFPDGVVNAFVEYEDLFIFQIFTEDPEEGLWDPFYSVDRNSGEFEDFSILTDGDTETIMGLFEQAQSLQNTKG